MFPQPGGSFTAESEARVICPWTTAGLAQVPTSRSRASSPRRFSFGSSNTTGSSARARLTVIGGLLEVVGIALLAIDFWWPPIRRSWPAARRWLEGGAAHVRAEAHVAATWLRCALRRKATVTGSAKLGLTFETNAAGVVTPAAARGKRTPS